MSGVEELRAVAAVVLAVSLPVAFVLLAIARVAREPLTPGSEPAPALPGAAPPAPARPGTTPPGAAQLARLVAWAGGLALASTALLLLLA